MNGSASWQLRGGITFATVAARNLNVVWQIEYTFVINEHKSEAQPDRFKTLFRVYIIAPVYLKLVSLF